MNIKRISAALAALLMCASLGGTVTAEQSASDITVYPSEGNKAVSPYIYGVNSGVDLSTVSAKSFRLGGNRMSAYNWENNMSNAGADWHNTADMYLITKAAQEFRQVPGGTALNASYEAKKRKRSIYFAYASDAGICFIKQKRSAHGKNGGSLRILEGAFLLSNK